MTQLSAAFGLTLCLQLANIWLVHKALRQVQEKRESRYGWLLARAQEQRPGGSSAGRNDGAGPGAGGGGGSGNDEGGAGASGSLASLSSSLRNSMSSLSTLSYNGRHSGNSVGLPDGATTARKLTTTSATVPLPILLASAPKASEASEVTVGVADFSQSMPHSGRLSMGRHSMSIGRAILNGGRFARLFDDDDDRSASSGSSHSSETDMQAAFSAAGILQGSQAQEQHARPNPTLPTRTRLQTKVVAQAANALLPTSVPVPLPRPPQPLGPHQLSSTQRQLRRLTSVGSGASLCRVQVVRSVGVWSAGVPREDSLHRALVGLLQQAKHFVYIEAELFCSDLGESSSSVTAASATSPSAGARSASLFPASFAPDSFYSFGTKEVDVNDATNSRRLSAGLGNRRQSSGLSTRGGGSRKSGRRRSARSRARARARAKAEAKAGAQNETLKNRVRHRVAEVLVQRILDARAAGRKFRVLLVGPLWYPGVETTGEHGKDGGGGGGGGNGNSSGMSGVERMRDRYEAWCRGRNSILEKLKCCGIEDPSEYVLFCGLRTHGRMGNGSVQTEQIHVHSKVLIVDDRSVMIGSADVDERSLVGDKDSEVSLVVEEIEDFSVGNTSSPKSAGSSNSSAHGAGGGRGAGDSATSGTSSMSMGSMRSGAGSMGTSIAAPRTSKSASMAVAPNVAGGVDCDDGIRFRGGESSSLGMQDSFDSASLGCAGLAGTYGRRTSRLVASAPLYCSMDASTTPAQPAAPDPPSPTLTSTRTAGGFDTKYSSSSSSSSHYYSESIELSPTVAVPPLSDEAEVAPPIISPATMGRRSVSALWDLRSGPLGWGGTKDEEQTAEGYGTSSSGDSGDGSPYSPKDSSGGSPLPAGRPSFAASLRSKLLSQHLGANDIEIAILATPWTDVGWQLICDRVHRNEHIYEQVFDCMPSDKVRR
jgi:phosphatidylserine/phosphatidylglycerophosphate/cardiolipin synthase-like enzyme